MWSLSGALICATVLVPACGADRELPVAPSQTPAHVVVSSGTTFAVSGVVTAAGVPAAGVRVAVLDQHPATPSITDASGRYSVQARVNQPWNMSPLLSASKPGFFSDTRFTDVNYAPITKDTQIDLALEPIRQIPLGQVISDRGVESTCSHWGYGTQPCQRFAVTAPSTGLLTITVSAAVIRFDVDVVRPDGTFAAYVPYPSGSPVRIEIPTEAGMTYEIRLTDPGAQKVELTTALRIR